MSSCIMGFCSVFPKCFIIAVANTIVLPWCFPNKAARQDESCLGSIWQAPQCNTLVISNSIVLPLCSPNKTARQDASCIGSIWGAPQGNALAIANAIVLPRCFQIKPQGRMNRNLEAPQGNTPTLQCHSHFILACDRYYVTCYLQHNAVVPTVCILILFLLLMSSCILGFL